MDSELKFPFYAKATTILIGLVALLSILYIAQGIIVPLVFAIIISILLHPVMIFFTNKGINKVFAIIITLSITIVVVFAFGALLFSQVSNFSESWPILVERFTIIMNDTLSWVSEYFNIRPRKINAWVAATKGELTNISGTLIGQTLMTVGGGLMVLLLIPVYTFILLYYNKLLIEFIHRLFGTNNQAQVSEIVSQTKSVIQRYLVGLVVEFALVAVMNIIALLLLGIDYAILLGIIGALLNVIPYIGGIIGVALPMMIAIATKSTAWYAMYIMVAYYIIQMIDNNIIVPLAVASKVKINALFSVIAVIVGNAVWGISGMFLSIPLLAIVKLICDHIESLKPWGFLLGDTIPSPPLLKIKQISLARFKNKPL